MGGRDLHSSGAELRIDEDRVADDRNLPVEEGVQNMFSVKLRIAGVLRMNRDSRVTEHRLGTRRRDHDLAAAFDGISELEHLPVLFFALNLEVRENGLRGAIPINEAFCSINEPFVKQTHEGFAHGD